MNRIIIFTASNVPLRHFDSFNNSKLWEVLPLPHSALRNELKKADSDTIYFTDYASIPEQDKTRDLNYLLKKQDVQRAIIDRKNEIDDPAELLMRGCDYISGRLLKNGIKPARLNKFTTWRSANAGDSEAMPPAAVKSLEKISSQLVPENGWAGIKSGKEYTFFMLFTEISIPSEWKKKSGNVHLNEIKQKFQTVVERISAAFDGKIWIWNEYGGLVLFCFDGSSCSPVIPAMKLLLNRALISIEDFDLHTPIRLRASMHLGNTIWKARGETGTIISDSLNSIFHLGTKYTPLDDLDITEDIYKLLIPRLKKLFNKAGSFEGRNIYRLCHLEVIT